MVAPVHDPQLVGLGDLRGEARTAGAQDAAFGVQHDFSADVLDFVLVYLLIHHGRVVLAVLHVVLLQAALPRLVADGAVQGMVHQVELQGPLHRVLHLLGVVADLDAFGDGGVAGRERARDAFLLHHAHAAHTGDRQAGVVTVMGHFFAVVQTGLQKVRAGGGLDLLAVPGQLHHFRGGFVLAHPISSCSL